MPAYIWVDSKDIEKIVSRYDKGETMEQIAISYGWSTPKISRLLREHGTQVRRMGPHALSPKQERDVPSLWNNGMNMTDIAKSLCCSTEPIKRILAEARCKGWVPVRPKQGDLISEARKQKGKILSLYKNGHSMYQIHKKLGIIYNYVRQFVQQSNMPIRDDLRRQGPNHPNFKGGRYVSGEGYVNVWIPPDHPFAIMRNKKGVVKEHRLVMAECIGRPLFKYEKVHHKNGNKQDNKTGNLELWERDHGDGQRAHENPSPHCPTCKCKQI